jgi:hypothetical protein
MKQTLFCISYAFFFIQNRINKSRKHEGSVVDCAAVSLNAQILAGLRGI